MRSEKPAGLVDRIDTLEELLQDAESAEVCAVDTEANSLYRYHESLCLVQFAWQDRARLIDPLAIEDLTPLVEYLDHHEIWMHGADYDMLLMKRQFGRVPEGIYDTQIGARLLGIRKFGLADLVEHYFGVVLSKTSQKANWGKRPLSPKMAEYAINDVLYLLPMRERMLAELREAGRLQWFRESCEAARLKVAQRDEEHGEPWRIRGSGRLDRAGLHYLKALWYWRDREAEKWDRPHFMVATNNNLMEWAITLAKGGRVHWPHHFRHDWRRRLNTCLEEAEKVPADDYPVRQKRERRRPTKGTEKRTDELLSRRDAVAEELGLEASIIASRATIEEIAAENEEVAGSLTQWQRECLRLD